MKSQLSLLSHPFYLILKNADRLLPGLEKLVAIFNDPEKDLLMAKMVSRETEADYAEDIDIDDGKVFLQKLRSKKTHIDWLTRSSLPFETESGNTNQYQIFSAIKDTVLILRFPNEKDGLYDLLLIYFMESSLTFGVKSLNTQLGPDHKNIIGMLIYNSINTIMHIINSDRSVYNNVIGSTRSVVNRFNEVQDELQRTQKNYGLSLVDLCKHYLNEFSIQYAKVYEMDSSGEQKITNYKGELNSLRNIIENAVVFADHLEYNNPNDVILITDVHIDFQRFDQHQTKKDSVIHLEERYARTIILLDKLEHAASTLYEQNLSLTGKNVGSNCPKPISAAAISDALSNHQKIIRYLIDKYPQKWLTIRNHFRPVKNILLVKRKEDDNLVISGRA